MTPDKESEPSTGDRIDIEEQAKEAVEQTPDRQLGMLAGRRLYDLKDRITNSKYQPLKLILILILTLGFLYWLLVFIEVISVSF